MKHFCLITNCYKDKNLEHTSQIVTYIRHMGGSAVSLISRYGEEAQDDFKVSDVPADTELIMVLGGDGTLIRTATKVESLHIPLLGVNLGTLGYLCELDFSSVFRAIDRLLQDDYILEKRIMLYGKKSDCEEDHLALNDIVIHHGGSIQTIGLNIYVNDEFLVRYDADGIILSTPTGSTGYNMSAGGPIVDPTGDALIMTPNNAHSLNSKSIVLNGDSEIEIEIARHIGKGKIYVSFDGDRKEEMTEGERIRVQRAVNCVTICKLHKRSFLEILSKKMEARN